MRKNVFIAQYKGVLPSKGVKTKLIWESWGTIYDFMCCAGKYLLKDLTKTTE